MTETTALTSDTSTVTAKDADIVIEKLKELVSVAGAQSHAYFDDLVELARKLS